MSNYNVGDIIKLTRISLGMSQEELSENICSVQTISRIENGKCSVKMSTYQQLMERMGRNGEKSYCALSVEDFDMLDLMVMANTALSKYDYLKLEEYLNVMIPKLGDTVINKQYIGRKRLLVDYRLSKITKKEFLNGLENLISLTIPDYKDLLNKVYPFMVEEVQLLMNIATAYREFEDYHKSIEIIQMLLRSLEVGYMGSNDAIQLKIILMNNLARAYGGLEDHYIAIEICKNAINKSKKYGIMTVLSNLYSEIAWNMIKQIEKGEKNKRYLKDCKKYLRKGYAVASLCKIDAMKGIIEKYYKGYFKENIYISSMYDNKNS